MFKVTSRGNYNKTKKALRSILNDENLADLDRYGQMGVDALRDATPKDTGLTAASWGYRLTSGGIWTGIDWFNANQSESGGPSVAVLIQFGHATRGGSYILGEDFINPAMAPVFDFAVEEVWRKVTA